MKFIAHYSKLNTKKGYILIEAIIAIGIAIVGILGILSVLSRSVSLNRVISDQFIGNYLAAEGIEVAKNIIDADWIKDGTWNNDYFESGDFEIDYQTQTFKSGSSFSARPAGNNPLLFDSANNIYSYSSGSPTNFIRKVVLVLSSDGNEIKVNSIVNWKTRGGGQFRVDLEDHFFNWQ